MRYVSGVWSVPKVHPGVRRRMHQRPSPRAQIRGCIRRARKVSLAYVDAICTVSRTHAIWMLSQGQKKVWRHYHGYQWPNGGRAWVSNTLIGDRYTWSVFLCHIFDLSLRHRWTFAAFGFTTNNVTKWSSPNWPPGASSSLRHVCISHITHPRAAFWQRTLYNNK